MAEFFYSIDVSVFYFINHTISNPLFDKFFVYITDVKHWYLVYTIFILALMIKGGRKGRLAAFGAILLVTASDQFSSFVLKDFFMRPRPCITLPDVNILVFCSGSGSFPSSHAVNNFAIAFFFARLYPNYKTALFATASVVAFSRPYVGVHYPSDILFGALVGSVLGIIFSYIVIKINVYWEEHPLNLNGLKFLKR